MKSHFSLNKCDCHIGVSEKLTLESRAPCRYEAFPNMFVSTGDAIGKSDVITWKAYHVSRWSVLTGSNDHLTNSESIVWYINYFPLL